MSESERALVSVLEWALVSVLEWEPVSEWRPAQARDSSRIPKRSRRAGQAPAADKGSFSLFPSPPFFFPIIPPSEVPFKTGKKSVYIAAQKA